jgi:hypothetical protein
MSQKFFGYKILNMFQGFVNKMTVIMKFSAMGPIDIPPWCNVFAAGTIPCHTNPMMVRSRQRIEAISGKSRL